MTRLVLELSLFFVPPAASHEVPSITVNWSVGWFLTVFMEKHDCCNVNAGFKFRRAIFFAFSVGSSQYHIKMLDLGNIAGSLSFLR